MTDADLLLGKLDPANFAGGSIALSAAAAAQALDRDVGGPLGLDTEAAAYGLCEVVDETMANAGRVHAVENGKDLTGFTMITFGGGGPLHAARLCEKMGIARFIVPPGAGVGSAIGFLRAPFGFEAVRSAVHRLSSFDAATVCGLVAAMTEEALSFVADGLAGRAPTIEITLFMRYVGQGWDIPVEVTGDIARQDATSLAALYEAAYARFFGRPIEGLDVEIVSWSVKASSPLPAVARVEAAGTRRVIPPPALRSVFDIGRQGFVPTGIYDRTALAVGDTVEGPAIITEQETSTMVTAAFTATVQPDGCLLVQRR